jgi:hypothetical protein
MTRNLFIKTEDPFNYHESPRHYNGYENESISKKLEELTRDYYFISNSEYESSPINRSDNHNKKKRLCHMIRKILNKLLFRNINLNVFFSFG